MRFEHVDRRKAGEGRYPKAEKYQVVELSNDRDEVRNKVYGHRQVKDQGGRQEAGRDGNAVVVHEGFRQAKLRPPG